MVRAKKHLGQHFLKNPQVAQKLADGMVPDLAAHTLEIGPGTGILTTKLLRRSENLKVVELDGESVIYLVSEQILPQKDVLATDFLKLDLTTVFNQPFNLVGNFPYNISSQIVFKLLENKEIIPQMVGMFQKEVADRLVANEGTKTYGILSVLSEVFYTREYLFTVEADQFNPPPKVRSAVIRFVRKDNPPELNYKHLTQVVKAAFNQRRKTLRNSLKSLNFPLELIPEEYVGLRPEQMSAEDFIILTQKTGGYEPGV